jgi:hypothetical protein
MAGLEVPVPTLPRVGAYLDTVALDGGSFYKYQPVRQASSPSTTAVGLLCRQYLGWEQNDPRLVKGAQFLVEHGIDWKNRDIYYWYYATQVLHHLGGDSWDRWNLVMREVLPSYQVKDGKEEGSWNPDGDHWGTQGGRLYTTCLSTYMLETYYRHLPLYSDPAP